MKFYSVAMIVFLITLGFGLVDNVLGAYIDYNVPSDQEWISKVNSDAFQNQSYSPANLEQSGDEQNVFGNFRLGLSVFIDALGSATVTFPWMLNDWGVPLGLAFLFALPIWLIYMVGLIQVFAKTSFGGMR